MDIMSINTEFASIIENVNANFAKANGAVYYHALSIENRHILNDLYNANLPTDKLGDGVCRACANWITSYGDLVWYDNDGVMHTLWECGGLSNPHYRSLFAVMDLYIHENVGYIGYPFYPDTPVVGQPTTNGYNHLHLVFSEDAYNPKVLRNNANQFIDLVSYCFHYTDRIRRMEVVLDYLRNQTATSHIEKSIETLTHLLQVIRPSADLPADKRMNYGRGIIHRLAIGDLAVMNGAISVFIDDYDDVEVVEESVFLKYIERTDPANYMRISRAFNANHLAIAERKLIDTGMDKALQRRSVVKGEVIPSIWHKPSVRNDGLLSSLTVRGAQTTMDKPSRACNVSLSTFIHKYLQDAQELYLVIGSGNQPFYGITTAVDDESPELFRHDGHLNIYTYTTGSSPSVWALTPRAVVRIRSVVENLVVDNNYFFLLEEGHHTRGTPLCLWKQTLSPTKVDAELINILAALTDNKTIPVNQEAVVAYGLNNHAFLPTVVYARMKDNVEIAFTLSSWE